MTVPIKNAVLGFPAAPAHLWQHFYHFTQTPRPSKHEQAISAYIESLAAQYGHRCRRDSFGNLVISVPASPGCEDRPTVIIQNHVDMVTVKTDDSDHNFYTDPLRLQVKDGWVQADRTTLGADNGVGCAAALALMTDPDVRHPPLELLFTMDEETGLGGALNLDASLLTGTHMLNLDTEDWGELFVGCAGGRDWQFNGTLTSEPIPKDHTILTVQLNHLAGGHSGIQIHEQLGNAIQLLAQWLYRAEQLGARLCHLQGGIAHNVIPRSATATIALPQSARAQLEALTAALQAQWLRFLRPADRQLTLEVIPTAPASTMLTLADHQRVRQCLLALPHGAMTYNAEQPADLVDLSINLAVVKVTDTTFFIESSLRFFNSDEAELLADRLLSTATGFGLTPKLAIDYPGWQPDFDSPLLALAKTLFEQRYGTEPKVKAIHAGLECGILLNKLPGIQALSFGPTIRGAHSPTERLDIATVTPFWEFLLQLLSEIR